MKLLFIYLLLILFTAEGVEAQNKKNYMQTISDTSAAMDFSYLRDTVFTVKPYFIEIDLAKQEGYLHSRNGEVKVFGISSGTNKLKDGVNTNEGLYVIQAKLPRWYSRQFDSTLMLNWLGFNFGIGFHALATSGYYNYLGKKKSSHGCVRISRPIAKLLYSIIDTGTPVLVHSGSSAVSVGFADSSINYKQYSYHEVIRLMKTMYRQLYSGRHFLNKAPVIIIDKFNVEHPGLPIGDSRKILKRQIIKSAYLFVSSVIPNYKYAEAVKNPAQLTSLNPGK